MYFYVTFTSADPMFNTESPLFSLQLLDRDDPGFEITPSVEYLGKPNVEVFEYVPFAFSVALKTRPMASVSLSVQFWSFGKYSLRMNCELAQESAVLLPEEWNSGFSSEMLCSDGKTAFPSGTRGIIIVFATSDDPFYHYPEQPEALSFPSLNAVIKWTQAEALLGFALINMTEADRSGFQFPSSLFVSEGSITFFEGVLLSRPLSNVSLSLSIAGEHSPFLACTPSSMLVLPSWNVSRPLNFRVDAFQTPRIAFHQMSLHWFAVSADPEYNELSGSIIVEYGETDFPGIVFGSDKLNGSEGESVNVTIHLTSQPRANVTLVCDVDERVAAMVSHEVTISPFEWNMSKSLQLSLLENDIAGQGAVYSELHCAVVSSDPLYSGMNRSLGIDILDNDQPGVIVSATEIIVSEGPDGNSTSFSVALMSEPKTPVFMSLSLFTFDRSTDLSSTEAGVRLSTPTLEISSSEWRSGVVVWVYSMENQFRSASSLRIVVEILMSSSVEYLDVEVPSVLVTVVDNDVPSLVIIPPASWTITEGETVSRQYGLKLGTQPLAPVEVLVTASNSLARVSPSSLEFTQSNWHIVQSVTFFAGNDNIASPRQAQQVTLSHSFASEDVNYAELPQVYREVTVIEDDVAGLQFGILNVNSHGFLNEGDTTELYVRTTSEPLDTALVSFTIERLTSYPGAANSTINLQPELSMSRSSISIAPSEWDVQHLVRLVAVDDHVAWTDTLTFRIVASVTSSTDGAYLGRSQAVEITVADNDGIGIVLSASLAGDDFAPTMALDIIEGSTMTYRMKLLSMPLAPLFIALISTSSIASGVTLSFQPTQLTIEPTSWNVPVLISIICSDDDRAQATNESVEISHVSQGVGLYSLETTTSLPRSLAPLAIVDVVDDDVAAILLSADYIIASEAPDSDPAGYEVRLGSQPAFPVYVEVEELLPSSNSTFQATLLSPKVLEFTSTNWNISQQVYFQANSDGLIESPIHEVIIGHRSNSSDLMYANPNPRHAILTLGIVDFDPSTLVDRTSAPVLLYAQLNESAWRLAVHFDRATTRGGMSTAVAQKCSETSIFDAATISVLDSGSSPSQCRWANDTTLQVLLPVSHPLRGGATLKLRGGVIRATATSVNFASGSVIVRGRLPVPAFKSARFGNAGVTITLNFTAPTSQQVGSGFGSGACTSLLRVSGGRSLGVGATCTWQSATTLVIKLGSGATVEPVSFQPQEGVAACNAGTSLQLVAGALGATSSSVLRSSGCVDIAQPASPPAPQARLVSPARIGICDDLRLDGLGSAGNGGRDLEYVWQVSGLNSFAVLTESNVSQYLADVGSVAVLSIPRELLLPDSVWRVSMTVSNFLSAVKDTTSTDVSVASDPIPQLTVQGEGSRRVRASTVVELKVIGRTPGCGGEESGKVLVYSWSLSSVSRDASATESSYQVPSIAGSTVSSWVSGDPRTLRIPSNRLTVGGVYEFKATARMAEKPNIMNEATVRVTVVSAPLSVLLRGGNRALGSGQSFSLDASAITDPDRMATLSLRWSWSCTTQSVSRPVCLTFLLQQLGCCCCCLSSQGEACKDANGSPVAALSSTASILTIPANTLAAGVYTFQVLVESGVSAGLIPNHYRSATASTSVTVLAGDPPNVAVPPLSSSVNRDQDVQLAGTASANTKLSWSVQDVPPSVAAAVLAASTRAGSTITIPRFTLSAGVSYTFRLTAVDLNSQMGFGEVQVVVNSPPSAGYLEASRVEAKFLQDAVDLSAKNWVDTDFDLPLTYRFAFLVGTNTTLPSTSVRSLPGEQVARGYGLVARATGLLPPQGNGPNYQVSVIGYIQDNLGAVTRATRNIQGQSLVLTVRPFVDESQSKEEQLAAVSAVAASIVEGAANEGDQEKLLSSITAVMGFLNAEDPDPCESCNENQTCVSDECVCIEGWSGESCEVPPEPVDAVVSYSEWSQCSRSCGGGVEQREVLCTPAKFGGVSCEELTNGTTIEERECNMQPCAVRIDGGWTAWSQWSACSASCSEGVGGSFSGIRSRRRSCTNPPPSPDGALCEGATVQTMVCSVQCPFPVLHCPGYSVVGGEGVECSGHGVCSVTAPDCTVDREGIDCFATCGCEDGWFDEDCGATEEEFELAQQLRSDMVSRLASSEIDSEDEEAKASVAKALENVAQNPAQLSSDAQDSVLGLANSLTGGNSSSVSSLNANSGYSILSAIGSLLQSSIQNAQVVRNLQVNDGGGNSTSSGARRLSFAAHEPAHVGRVAKALALGLLPRETRSVLAGFSPARRLSAHPHLPLAMRVLSFDWNAFEDENTGAEYENDSDLWEDGLNEDPDLEDNYLRHDRGTRLLAAQRLLDELQSAVEVRAAGISGSVTSTVNRVATGVQTNAVAGGPATTVWIDGRFLYVFLYITFTILFLFIQFEVGALTATLQRSDAEAFSSMCTDAGTCTDLSLSGLNDYTSSTVDVRVMEWKTNPYGFSEQGSAVAAPITSIQFTQVNGSAVEVKNLTTPAFVLQRVSASIDRSNFKCASDEEATAEQPWSRRGLSLIRFVEDGSNLFALCASVHFTAFTVVVEESFPSLNVINPFADFGSLTELLDPSNMFPLIILGIMLVGFLFAWILSLCIDRRSAARLEKLRTAQFLKFGQFKTGRGVTKLNKEAEETLRHAASRKAIAERKRLRDLKRERARRKAAEKGTFALLVHYLWFDYTDRLRRNHLWGSVFLPVSLGCCNDLIPGVTLTAGFSF